MAPPRAAKARMRRARSGRSGRSTPEGGWKSSWADSGKLPGPQVRSDPSGNGAEGSSGPRGPGRVKSTLGRSPARQGHRVSGLRSQPRRSGRITGNRPRPRHYGRRLLRVFYLSGPGPSRAARLPGTTTNANAPKGIPTSRPCSPWPGDDSPSSGPGLATALPTPRFPRRHQWPRTTSPP